MKKILLSLAVTATAVANVMAQACTPDPSYVALGVGVYPQPDSTDIGTTATGINSPLGCATVGQPYEFTFTAVVPSSYTLPTGPITISRVDLTAIQNRPAGISYTCNPAGSPATNGTCSFPGNSTSCVKLSGTPTTAGMYDMKVKTKIYTAIPLPLNQDFPPSAGNPIQDIKGRYALVVMAAGADPAVSCPSYRNSERFTKGSLGVRLSPNPVSDVAIFNVSAKKFTNEAKLMVKDLSGRVIAAQNITIDGIENNLIQFDCTSLNNGLYFYTIEANGDRVSERFVVQH
jgi:Secretion system C-terminal sorting domain